VVGAVALIPESPERDRLPVDVAGAALLGLGLAALLLAISKGENWGWTSTAILGLFIASALLLLVFGIVESRARQPLVDLALVATQPFANANVCAFAAGASFFVVLIVVPQLAAMPEVSGYGFGYTTTQTGLLLLPMAVVAMVAAGLAGRAMERVGPRAFMAVGSAVGVGAYVFAAFEHGRAAHIAIVTGLIGVTFGFTLTAIAAVVVRNASEDKTSIAAGVNSVVRTTASALAAALAAAIITGAGLVGPFPAESGFTRAFVLGAIACGLGLAVSPLLPGRRAARVDVG
jgi:MFS family permease